MVDDFHCTDLGNALRFVERHGLSLRYVPAFNAWVVWAGTHWQRDEDGEAERRAKDTVLAIYDAAALLFSKAAELAKAKSFNAGDDEDQAKALAKRAQELLNWAKHSEGAARIAAMLRLAQTERGVPVAAELLDADGWLLNFSNGTVDMRTTELRPHDRKNLLTFVLPFEYDPAARCAVWEEFLDFACPDLDEREYLQRAAGASLVGEARDDKVLLLTGPGGSGKSTFQEALKGALGPYAASASLEAFVGRKGSRGAADPELAALRGKRAAFVPEAGSGATTVELLKAATGGDTLLVRGLYERPFELRPTFTFWLRANTRPRLPDNDSGLRRRLVELPFHHVFASPDETVRETLKSSPEAQQAVMAWALQGLERWREHGLRDIPDVISESTKDLWKEMNPLSDFYDECCVIGPGHSAYASKLYSAYQEWARANGLRQPLTGTAFGKRLVSDGRFQRRRAAAGLIYKGIGLAVRDGSSAGFEAAEEAADNGPSAADAGFEATEEAESAGFSESDAENDPLFAIGSHFDFSHGETLADGVHNPTSDPNPTSDNGNGTQAGGKTCPDCNAPISIHQDVCVKCWSARERNRPRW